jgi:hypothetical protein
MNSAQRPDCGLEKSPELRGERPDAAIGRASDEAGRESCELVSTSSVPNVAGSASGDSTWETRECRHEDPADNFITADGYCLLCGSLI